MTYNAITTTIRTRPHPNADRLQLGDVLGTTVVVGLDVQDGQLGVYFPTDGQLSDEFCQLNDLYPRFDESGNRLNAGYIDPDSRRVRTQKLRGEKSDGLFMDLQAFNHLVYAVSEHTFIDGVQFDSLNGRPICNKYVSRATKEAIAKSGKAKKTTLRETPMMPMHFDTAQLAYSLPSFRYSPNGTAIFTEKLHGTSGRYGHVLVERQLSRLERLAQWLGVKVQQTEWAYLMGTRRVLVGSSSGTGYYGDDSFRYRATRKLAGFLYKGEVVYFEIVGYADGQKAIMPAVDTTKAQDKELIKQYGKSMGYTYGNAPGECTMYVYRITRSNEDGDIIELTWDQVVARCEQLGVNTVPELTRLALDSWHSDKIMELANILVEGSSTLDQRHIREGVCVRFEDMGKTETMKHKSFIFKVLEGIAKVEEVADMEESS